MKTADLNLETVWGQYRSGLNAYLHSRVSNPSDAEELLQDILLKTHDNIDMLGNSESLKSWLFQIAHNTTVDFYRKKGRRDAVHPDDLWFSDANVEERHELEGCVAPFIDALPKEMGDLLRTIELEGVPQKDHAAELGVSYSTLKSRVQTARRRLRQVFESCCSFSLDTQGNIIGYKQNSSGCDSCS